VGTTRSSRCLGPFLPIHQLGGSCWNATHSSPYAHAWPIVGTSLAADIPVFSTTYLQTLKSNTSLEFRFGKLHPGLARMHLSLAALSHSAASPLSLFAHRRDRNLSHLPPCCIMRTSRLKSMRRPFIAILAIVAGLAGLAIGMAASRGRHLSPRPLASRLHESAESSSIKPVANTQSQPDVTALVGDDDDAVIRFCEQSAASSSFSSAGPRWQRGFNSAMAG